MRNVTQEYEQEIAFYQALAYGIFEIAAIILSIFSWKLQNLRINWKIMVIMSIFININYVTQIGQSLLFMENGESINADIILLFSCIGQYMTLILYLRLITKSVKNALIRIGMHLSFKFHSFSIILPILITLIYQGIAVYNIIWQNSSINHDVLDWVEAIFHLQVCIIAIWNLIIKRIYTPRKYLKNRCYSWILIFYFVLTTILAFIVAAVDYNDYKEFLINICMNLIIDLGPLLVMAHFSIIYTTSSSKNSFIKESRENHPIQN